MTRTYDLFKLNIVIVTACLLSFCSIGQLGLCTLYFKANSLFLWAGIFCTSN